jgi:hypothetical protein
MSGIEGVECEDFDDRETGVDAVCKIFNTGRHWVPQGDARLSSLAGLALCLRGLTGWDGAVK